MSETNSNNVLFGKNLFLVASIGTAIGTSMLLPTYIEESYLPMHTAIYKNMEQDSINEQFDFIDGVSYSTEQKVGLVALSSFINDINQNSHDIDIEIQQIINDNFWNMI